MVSIKDVARAAGVSDKTVSRVVNNEPNVRVSTMELVQRTIQELNYVPDLNARLIRTNRSRSWGIMTDLISTTPYSGDIVRGIQDWARANGRTVLLANTGGLSDQEIAAWRAFRQNRIEGVLYVTMYQRLVEMDVEDAPIPTVLVNCLSTSARPLPSVTPDDERGSIALTNYVLDQGHRDIAYIQLNPVLYGAELRYRAFRETVAARGLSLGRIDAPIGMTGKVGAEENRVFAEAMRLFAGKRPPTAVICGNDEIALQVYIAALTSGLRIPDDVSIVGFDDFQTISIGLKPALTTAALPYYDLGFRGADRLDRVLRKEPLRSQALKLDCRLVIRGSCGPARK